MATIQDLDDTTAASLVLHSLTKKLGKSLTRKTGFLGLGGQKATFDIIVRRTHVDEKYGCYTFYAVRGGKAKSSAAVYGEIVVKEVIKQLFGHFVGQMSPVYSMSDNLNKAIGAGNINTSKIYAQATKIGGQMQLHQAKKMGRDVYDQCRIFGLGANVLYGGAMRLEIKKDNSSYLEIMLRAWGGGLSGSAKWIDRFEANGGEEFKKIQNWGGHWKANYKYKPQTGFEAA